jgi:hypothetical protein
MPAIKAMRRLAAKESIRIHLFGGALRDLYLGLSPDDLDFVIAGDPGEFVRKVAELAPGRTWTFESPLSKCGYYRGELGNLDFVHFRELTIQEFIERHFDFTVNSMVYDLAENVILDVYRSKEDLDNQIIRSITSVQDLPNGANVPLRGVRLALLTPEFRIDRDTFSDIKLNTGVVARAKPARVGYELSKILESQDCVKGVRLLQDTGLLREVFRCFLPCAGLDDEAVTGAGDQSSIDSLTRRFERFDELITPFRQVYARDLLVLRLALLLTPLIRERALGMPPDERKQFLMEKGGQLERDIYALCILPSRAFRVRMLTIAYLLGMSSLFDGTAKLDEVVERSVERFGAWKGFYASSLITADWLASEGNGTAGQGRLEASRRMLRSKMAPLLKQKREKEFISVH